MSYFSHLREKGIKIILAGTGPKNVRLVTRQHGSEFMGWMRACSTTPIVRSTNTNAFIAKLTLRLAVLSPDLGQDSEGTSIYPCLMKIKRFLHNRVIVRSIIVRVPYPGDMGALATTSVSSTNT